MNTGDARRYIRLTATQRTCGAATIRCELAALTQAWCSTELIAEARVGWVTLYRPTKPFTANGGWLLAPMPEEASAIVCKC